MLKELGSQVQIQPGTINVGNHTKYGKRIFTYTGPKLWNALPLDIREEDNVVMFKQKVKTLLFEGTTPFLEHAFVTTLIYTVTAHFLSVTHYWTTVLLSFIIK